MNYMNYIEQLKVPMFFIEFLFLIMGLCFIFIINVIYQPDINQIFHIEYFSDPLKGIFLFSTAYVLGRLFSIIGHMWNSITLFILFRKDKCVRIKELYRFLVSIINEESHPIHKKSNMIKQQDIENYIEKNKSVKTSIERDYYEMIFIQIAIGASISLFFFIPGNSNVQMFIIALITSLSVIHSLKRISRNKERIGIAEEV